MLLAVEETGLKKSSQGKITIMSFYPSFNREICLQHTVVTFLCTKFNVWWLLLLYRFVHSTSAKSFSAHKLIPGKFSPYIFVLPRIFLRFVSYNVLNFKINVNHGRVSSAGRLLVCREGCDVSDPGNQTWTNTQGVKCGRSCCLYISNG